MKRGIVFFLIFLSLVYSISAEVFNKDFTINAYKLGSDIGTGSVKMEITDAISSSLDILVDNAQIDITSSMRNILGDITNTNNDNLEELFGRHVVFSYRVYGNATGKYRLDFKFSDDVNPRPFESSQGQMVDFTASIRNKICEFTKVPAGAEFWQDDSSESYTYEGLTYKVEILDKTSSGNQGNTVTINHSENGDVQHPYGSIITTVVESSIRDSNQNIVNGTIKDGVWLTRGVIGLTIDSSDFDQVEAGLYSLDVSVVLSSVV